MLRLIQLDLQLGNGGSRAREQRRRLAGIELGGRAVPEARLSDVERVLLNAHVLARLSDQDLVGADHHVRTRDLRGQRDDGREVVRDRREHRGGLGLDAPAIPTPEVELPGRVEPRLVDAEVTIEIGDVRPVVAEPDGRVIGPDLLRLRELLAGGDAELRARLDDAQAGDLQREVLLVGEIDEAIERDVVELLPPQAVGLGLRGDARFARWARSSRGLGLPRLEVWTYLAPCEGRREEDA